MAKDSLKLKGLKSRFRHLSVMDLEPDCFERQLFVAQRQKQRISKQAFEKRYQKRGPSCITWLLVGTKAVQGLFFRNSLVYRFVCNFSCVAMHRKFFDPDRLHLLDQNLLFKNPFGIAFVYFRNRCVFRHAYPLEFRVHRRT